MAAAGGPPGGPRPWRGGGAGGPAGQSRARRHARFLSPPHHARALAPPPPLPPLSRAGRGPPANQPAPGNPAALATASAAPIGRRWGGGAEPLRKDELEGAGADRRAPGGPAPRRGRRRAGSAPHPAAARGTGLLKGPRSRLAPQPQIFLSCPTPGSGRGGCVCVRERVSVCVDGPVGPLCPATDSLVYLCHPLPSRPLQSHPIILRIPSCASPFHPILLPPIPCTPSHHITSHPTLLHPVTPSMVTEPSVGILTRVAP